MNFIIWRDDKREKSWSLLAICNSGSRHAVISQGLFQILVFITLHGEAGMLQHFRLSNFSPCIKSRFWVGTSLLQSCFLRDTSLPSFSILCSEALSKCRLTLDVAIAAISNGPSSLTMTITFSGKNLPINQRSLSLLIILSFSLSLAPFSL